MTLAPGRVLTLHARAARFFAGNLSVVSAQALSWRLLL
jgi:hypothetical protein